MVALRGHDHRVGVGESVPRVEGAGDRVRGEVRPTVRNDQRPRPARIGDYLLIAGKGHESGQVIGTDVYPFDDVEQASVAVAALDGVI